MAPAPSITQPVLAATTTPHDKKTILKNAVNQNEQIEKQSVIDGEGDKTSLDNMVIYNDSIDGTPPASQQNKTRKNSQTKNTSSKLNTTRAQDANSQPQPPHQPFPFPKKSLAKEKNAIAAAKNNNSKKSTTTDKENEQQKLKSNSNAKNLALKVVNKEASVTSFKEDDQVIIEFNRERVCLHV